MTQRYLFVVVSLWLFTYSTLPAQVGFHLPFLNNVNSGSYIIVPVTVTNFDSIVSAQFVIQWDPEVLQFQQIFSYNLPGLDSMDFGLNTTQDSGLLRFAWSAPSLQNGVSVPDGNLIFRMSFHVIGELETNSAMTITENPPTLFEVVKAGYPGFGMNQCVLTNGFVAVGYTVATAEPGDSDFPVTIFPNPFSGISTAFFKLDTPAEVEMTVTDTRRRVLTNQKKSYASGQHGMEIVCDQLQQNGIYFLILRTAEHSCVRPLVKQ